jgi:hypothetical protein
MSDLLQALLDSALDLARRLPAQPLPAGERHRLGGHLFTRDEEMVDELAYALSRRPHLFPDLPLTAEEIWARHGEAGGWLLLGQIFSGLSTLCLDNHVRVKGGLVIACKAALRKVIVSANNPEIGPPLPHDERIRLLTPALRPLYETNQAKGKKPPRPEAAEEKPKPNRQAAARRRQRLHGWLELLIASLGKGE